MNFHFPWSHLPSDHELAGKPHPDGRIRRILVFAGVLALGCGAAVYGWKVLALRQAEAAVRRAREHLATGEYRLAQLTLEQSLQVNPRDVEAMGLLADFYSRAGLPRGPALWRELVRLEPENDLYGLGLAEALVRSGDRAGAEGALGAVSRASRMAPQFLRIEAALAYASADTVRLAAALRALEAANPTDPRAVLNRAVLQLNSREPAEAAAARETLIGLARGGSGRIRATLELFRHAQRRGDPPEIARLAAAIVEPLSRAARLQALVLVGIPSPGVLDLVEHMKQEPTPTTEDARQLSQFMRWQGLTREALLWLEGLPLAERNSPEVMAEAAACAAEVRDWHRLERLLAAGAWDRVPADVLLLAFAARLQREQAALERSAETWTDAVRLARGSLTALRGLVRLSEVFQWPEQTVATLWTLVRQQPGERAAWQALAARAEAEGSADKLVEVLETWARLQPFDDRVQAEALLVNVLLRRAPPGTTEPARGAVRPGPEPLPAVAARAVELTRAGRAAEAAALLASVSGAGDDAPRVALARAFVYSENGDLERARFALQAASRVRFLPEEQALLESVRRKCRMPALNPPVPPPRNQGTS
jgi:tetratricopeptide (TPR) repeat protein